LRLGKYIFVWAVLVGLGFASAVAAAESSQTVRIKDITSVEGIRDNPIMGYGVVVGLSRTGDSQQTVFSIQTLSNLLQRMGLQIPAASVRVNNIAAVFVTATLPPFARPGMKIDVTVSSIGDAKSLAGGILLMTPLKSSNGNVYAVAQGALTLGGYSAGGGGNSKVVNHLTVGRIPDGASIEQDTSVALGTMNSLSLLLRDPDFGVAMDIAEVINKEVGKDVARAVDSRRVEIASPNANAGGIPSLMARIDVLEVQVHATAKVVVNERTGTIVMGGAMTIGPCSILQGNLAIEIATKYEVSQPQALGKGDTVVVPQTDVQATEKTAQLIQLKQGATVEDLVQGLQKMGATARDIVSILQAIKAAHALQADLEVL
jgi:flagellar P-ring protein precursor FlgI